MVRSVSDKHGEQAHGRVGTSLDVRGGGQVDTNVEAEVKVKGTMMGTGFLAVNAAFFAVIMFGGFKADQLFREPPSVEYPAPACQNEGVKESKSATGNDSDEKKGTKEETTRGKRRRDPKRESTPAKSTEAATSVTTNTTNNFHFDLHSQAPEAASSASRWRSGWFTSLTWPFSKKSDEPGEVAPDTAASKSSSAGSPEPPAAESGAALLAQTKLTPVLAPLLEEASPPHEEAASPPHEEAASQPKTAPPPDEAARPPEAAPPPEVAPPPTPAPRPDTGEGPQVAGSDEAASRSERTLAAESQEQAI